MLYHKEGFPEESALVVCTVTKVQHHSVFVTLNAYGKSAMMHISEISPGRIRNIRDYVKEGKTIVCKVLSVRQDKNQIDVSLRRVSEGQRMNVMNQMKLELTAEKIIEFLAKEKKLDVKKTYDAVYKAIEKEYDFIFEAFSDYVQEKNDFPKTTLKDADQKALLDLVKQRIKPPQVELTAKFSITSFADTGIEDINTTFKKACAVDTKHLRITYGGNGIYNVRIIHDDFKSAEKILSEVVSVVSQKFEDSKNAVYAFEKHEGKQIS